MPGKRARKHFSQLSEFERGLIIGMKTAGWLTRRVAGQVDRSECAVRNCWEQWTRKGTHSARETGFGATRKTTRIEDRMIIQQALVDPTVTRSTIRADVGVAIVSQTISRHLAEANLKSKRPFRALPLTPEHRQLRLQWCQARSMWNVTDWQKVVFSDESRFVWGTDDNRVRVWRRPEHVWDQLKRQMPSCHSLHDLELAVQDLWAHLPQDNIRCLINSMPDFVTRWCDRLDLTGDWSLGRLLHSISGSDRAWCCTHGWEGGVAIEGRNQWEAIRRTLVSATCSRYSLLYPRTGDKSPTGLCAPKNIPTIGDLQLRGYYWMRELLF
ncbi:uncharacterized protein TNCV_5134461 [Trichonephila clavipes]|nr:uncharacterized protein TNCV_5134461 [Trichonephila clavipes]